MVQKIIIKQSEKVYGVDSDKLELLGGFDDNVFLSHDRNIVIKFLDTKKHRKENLLKELEVIKLMSTNGINTPAPILSQNGKFICGYYSASCPFKLNSAFTERICKRSKERFLYNCIFKC